MERTIHGSWKNRFNFSNASARSLFLIFPFIFLLTFVKISGNTGVWYGTEGDGVSCSHEDQKGTDFVRFDFVARIYLV